MIFLISASLHDLLPVNHNYYLLFIYLNSLRWMVVFSDVLFSLYQKEYFEFGEQDKKYFYCSNNRSAHILPQLFKI